MLDVQNVDYFHEISLGNKQLCLYEVSIMNLMRRVQGDKCVCVSLHCLVDTAHQSTAC
jgi:hypothetical protein